MKLIYLFLLAILLATYGLALRRVKQSSARLTPVLGWLIGLGFFLLAPLAILTLNGGFRQPAVYDFDGSWDAVSYTHLDVYKRQAMDWAQWRATC